MDGKSTPLILCVKRDLIRCDNVGFPTHSDLDKNILMAHISGIDHVQLAMPPGAEDAARAFYTGVLGLPEIPKPADLVARSGGCWFAAGHLQIHMGGEAGFVPAKKAHPALLVDGFDDYLAGLAAQGVAVTLDVMVAGRKRAAIADTIGNRIEQIEQLPSA
jgi:catechol 2,3-dioxygenase-like lactoylglutathione lyase family enzyme